MWWFDQWDYWPMPWMFFGPVVMVIFVVFCVTMMWLMMRGGMRHHSRGGYALEVLKERYARGEIDKTEYEERRRLLQA